MSKSKLEDGVADAVAATAIISVVLVTLVIWLSGSPAERKAALKRVSSTLPPVSVTSTRWPTN